MSTGAPLRIVDDATAAATKRQFDLEKAASARLHLDAWAREMERDRRRNAAPVAAELAATALLAGAAGAAAAAVAIAWAAGTR